jgi:hypothetical protein
MITLLGLFLLVQVVVHILLREERRPVDALQLQVLLISQPVGAGDVQQLEGLDSPSRRDMRAAAKVRELARAINRDLFIGPGELLDEVALHEIAFVFELLETLLAGQKLARIGDVLLHQFLHLLLDLL